MAVSVDAAARPHIDPRFARRWVEVRRAQGRRRLHVLVAILCLLVAAGLASGTLYTPLFKVRHVRVTVAGTLSPAQVVADAGLNHYRLMIDTSTGALAHRLDAVPGLGAATASRQWPGTIRIAVAVRTPIAQVAVPGAVHPTWATVDPTGRVLAYLSRQATNLPLLSGLGSPPAPGGWLTGSAGPGIRPGAAPTTEVDMDAAADGGTVPRGAAAALAALQALPASARADVTAVTVGSAGSLAMTLASPVFGSGPIAVTFGDGSQLAAKLTALAALLAQGTLDGVQAIDLTVPSRPATLTAR